MHGTLLALGQTKAALERFRGTPAELSAAPAIGASDLPPIAIVTQIRDVHLGEEQPRVRTQREQMEREERERVLERARGRRRRDVTLRVRGVENEVEVEFWADDLEQGGAQKDAGGVASKPLSTTLAVGRRSAERHRP